MRRLRSRHSCENGPQIPPLDVLHCDVVGTVDLAEVVDVNDVVVVQLGGQLGLVDEHRDELFAVGQIETGFA